MKLDRAKVHIRSITDLGSGDFQIQADPAHRELIVTTLRNSRPVTATFEVNGRRQSGQVVVTEIEFGITADTVTFATSGRQNYR